MPTTIELTEQQQKAIDGARGEPARVLDPRTRTAYVLVPADQYESIEEILQDEREQREWHDMAARNMARRMDEPP